MFRKIYELFVPAYKRLKVHHGCLGSSPTFMTDGAACADVFSAESKVIEPFSAEKINLDISFEIPKGYCIKMTSRSSLLYRGLISQLGIIDSDYTGVVRFPVYNGTDKPITILIGERLGQIELCKLGKRPVAFAKENNTRNQKGFGGTGL